MTTTANLAIHCVIHRLHLSLVHAWWCSASISILGGIHVTTTTRTALLHPGTLLQSGVLSSGSCVHHRTCLHAVRQVRTVKHLTVHGAKVTVGERAQILTDVGVRVTLSDGFICIHLQTVLANRRQMDRYKHLHTEYCSSSSVIITSVTCYTGT